MRRPGIPVVYNSGGYERVETLRELEGLIDIYLPDLKYLSPELSRRYSGAENYPQAAMPAILEMARQPGKHLRRISGVGRKQQMTDNRPSLQNTVAVKNGRPCLTRHFEKDVYKRQRLR